MSEPSHPEEAPPQVPGELEVHDALPQWPKVIGIISICLAGLGLTCQVCGVAMAPLSMSMMPADQRDQFPPNMGVGPLIYLAAALSLPHVLLLLAAGVQTLRRRASGKMLHLIYALLALPLVAFGIWVQFEQQANVAQWVRENPDTTYAKQMQMPGAAMGQQFGLIFGVCFGLAYPIFLLIWFGIVKAKADMGTPRTDTI